MVRAGSRLRAAPAALQPAASKVPEVTAWFWVIKILTTGMGEATSDYLVHRINPVIAVGLGFAGLVFALALQFAVRRYLIWVYWLAVVMVAVFGTMEADVLHVGLGVPYAVSTAGFAVVLAAIFAIWFAAERTLSIHSIRTRRREMFYWASVMATFALGTAAGDLTAYSLGLGYLASGILFTLAILVPAFGYWRLRLHPVAAFWFAYILTRPLGASFADWLGVPHALGGLGLGRGPVSLALTVLIVVLVGYLAISGRDADGAPAEWEAPHRVVAAGREPAHWGANPAAARQPAGWETAPREPDPWQARWEPGQPDTRPGAALREHHPDTWQVAAGRGTAHPAGADPGTARLPAEQWPAEQWPTDHRAAGRWPAEPWPTDHRAAGRWPAEPWPAEQWPTDQWTAGQWAARRSGPEQSRAEPAGPAHPGRPGKAGRHRAGRSGRRAARARGADRRDTSADRSDPRASRWQWPAP